MTDEELQRACAELYAQIDKTARNINCYEYGLPRYGKADQFMPMLLAFSRRMQAVGLRRAGAECCRYYGEYEERTRTELRRLHDWCEAEAQKLEAHD